MLRARLVSGALLLSSRAASASTNACFDKFCDYRLLEKESQGSSGSQLLTFELPAGETLGGLGVEHAPTSVYAQHPQNASVQKSYSPVSGADDVGSFQLLVKPYAPRPGGGLGSALCALEPGDSASLRVKPVRVMHGATGVVGRWKEIGLVAGGTGIAPLFQVLRHVLPETKVSLLYSSRGDDDVLMRDEIDALAAAHPGALRVRHTITDASAEACSADAAGGAMDVARGRITLDLVRSSLPQPGDGVMVFVCGTDGFVDALAGPIARVVDEATGKKKKVQGPLGGLLREAGFSEEMVYKF